MSAAPRRHLRAAIGTDFALRASSPVGCSTAARRRTRADLLGRARRRGRRVPVRRPQVRALRVRPGSAAWSSTGGPIERSTNFVLAVGGGLDMLVSRSWSYGVEGRLASFGGDVTVFTPASAARVRWGYF